MENLQNYEDLLLTDKNGVIIFCDLSNYDFFNLKPDEIIGKRIYELHKNINESNSTVMKVLREGEPIINIKEKIITKKDRVVYQMCSILPLKVKKEVIGAIEISKCIYDKNSITSVRTHSNNKIYRKNQTIYTVNDIISQSQKMNEIKKSLYKIAKTDSSVFIYGETGTGKEMIAQSIHNLGNRFFKVFVSQNCAAIPESLFESILFGTEAGSFTGSMTRKGLFELAEGGTLFLDEINSIPLNIQTKLLKAIEEKRIRRIGGINSINVDVRIIAASNENPFDAARQNFLRKDLLYRLSVVSINLPSLRERKEDIIPLLNFFIMFYNKRMKMNIMGVDDEVKKQLLLYDWPGNVRELKYMIEGSFNKSDNHLISINDIPDEIRTFSKQSNTILNDMKKPLRDLIETYEKEIIMNNIKSSKSLSEAARNMKISRQTLNYKINKYDINIEL